MLLFKQKIINNAHLLIYKDFTESFEIKKTAIV